MIREIRFSSRAERQLDKLFAYIEAESGMGRAEGFVSGIVEYCQGLKTFPERGTCRDDIRPGLRVVGYRRRCGHCVRGGAGTGHHHRCPLWWSGL